MSSKASSTPTNPTLPSFFSLFRSSLVLIRQNFGTILGYTGWLLLPITAHIIIRTTLGLSDLGSFLDLIASVAFILIAINLYNTIALHVPVWQTKYTSDSERLAASTTATSHAQKNITTVLWVIILSSLISLVGYALIIPGLIFATWFAFAPLTILFENTRGLAALQRSRNLIRGRFWSTALRFWSFELLILITYLIIAGLILVAFGFQPSASFGEWTPPLAADTLMNLLELVVIPLIVVYTTLLYQALKVE